MRHFFLIIFFFSTIQVLGQGHAIGLIGGISWVDVKSEYSEYIQNQKFFRGGLTYEHQFNNNIVAGLHAIFAQKGYSDKTIFSNPDTTDLIVSIDSRYNYISFPIKAGYKFGNKFSGLINIGLVPSFLLIANYIAPPISGFTDGEKIEFSEKVSKFDFAGTIEFGCNYNLESRTQLFALLSYQHSFSNLNKSGELLYEEMKFAEFIASLGVKYSITKN